jgi:hypothetical protein
MFGGTWGPDISIRTVLRQRGFRYRSEAAGLDPLLPREHTLSGEQVNTHRDLFGRASFRKLLRRLTSGGSAGATLDELEGIAGAKAQEYLAHLDSVGALQRTGSAVALSQPVDNIGPSLEWYVADLFQGEFDAAAAWGVKIGDLSVGGDFDVLAWVNSALAYVETKSAHPSQIDDSQLRNFLQRSEELAPELAILLIDSDANLDDVHDRMFAIMLPLLRKSNGVTDESWPPDGQFVKPQLDFNGVSYGYRRLYITGSQPSIATQLGRCLRHYQMRVRGQAFWGSDASINFVTGEVQKH